MSFSKDIEPLQKQLSYAGYSEVREPYDISSLSKPEAVVECETIASKSFFNILYLEVKSNWKAISQEVAKKNENPCLVITSYGDYTILATMKDHTTLHAKPRYVVIDDSKPQLLSDFIKSIKVKPNDNVSEIYDRVQKTFVKFSEYQQAIDEFAENLESIIENTKSMIDDAISGNKRYDTESKKLLKMCQETINDKMGLDDIKEMLIQHILTYRIFALVYDEHDFHNINAVAKSLESLKSLLRIPSDAVDYKTMEIIAESITDIDQRQEFLKKIYETFYKKFDPAKADREGIVYTPLEVVHFMVRSTDLLLKKHFKKSISDDGITILDPATGTGTFLVYILRQISVDKLEQKYTKEIHANEISILPYYIAALNIEHTYKELKGDYKEFKNICWMDTLDSGTKDYEKLSAYFKENDNVKRISRQQKSKICVIIGNPPYNAVQTSFNDANPADNYPHIDEKIREDYNKYSTTTNKLKAFDMYKRFLKWSSERIKGNGMVVLVSNNSFLDGKANDGVRRALYDEFDYIYTVNLKGDARLAGDAWRRQGGKIFGGGSRVGVAISFFIKTGEKHSEIQYAEITDYTKREEKLKWLDEHTISTLEFREIIPDDEAVWLNQTKNNFDELPSILPRDTKESIFENVIVGINTGKDEWVYDINKINLEKKMKFYISFYNEMLQKHKIEQPTIKSLIGWINKKIKWSFHTLQKLERGHTTKYSDDNIQLTLYRPFIVKYQYFDSIVTEILGKFPNVFKNSQENLLIGFPNPKTNSVFSTIGTNLITGYDLLGGTKNIPLWQYGDEGKKHSNITKYGLELFCKHYKNKKINDEDIFYYVYAMFSDPKYEENYRYNLQRSSPRIPLAQNFEKLSEIGRKLFDLHCNFNDVKEYGLKRTDKIAKKNKVRLLLKKEKDNIKIIIDDITTMENVPKEIFEYTLGSKNPLQWILEFYKESKNQISNSSSDDESIRKRFNTYKFEEHKEQVITLLNKVTTVCVETVKLRNQLKEMEWGPQPKLKFTKIAKKDEKKPKKIAKAKKKNKSREKRTEQAHKKHNLDNYI